MVPIRLHPRRDGDLAGKAHFGEIVDHDPAQREAGVGHRKTLHRIARKSDPAGLDKPSRIPTLLT